MFNELDKSLTDQNKRLINLVSRLTYKAIDWKIKVMEGDHPGADKNLQEMEKILEQMKLYASTYKIH